MMISSSVLVLGARLGISLGFGLALGDRLGTLFINVSSKAGLSGLMPTI